jgi:DNA oxidative demethylase
MNLELFEREVRDQPLAPGAVLLGGFGLPAVFLFGGLRRADQARRVPLSHGDVVVWGGPARLRFHCVMPLDEGQHPRLGRRRINLTFRTAT